MKYLGQYFLINKIAIKKIAGSLDLKKDEVVVEVGPGHGELTGELIKHSIKKLVVVERDRKLANALKFRISNFELRIIEGDILKELPKISGDFPKYKLVGNIPYYLTSYLLRIISELKNKPSLIVFTIQKEVAERIVAKPPRMNLLAASVQFWAEPKIIDILPANYFNPQPKVESAIIKLKTKNLKCKIDEQKYYKFIKTLFKQPRKTILNNLTDGLDLTKEEIRRALKKLKIKESARPQNLNLHIIFQLLHYFY